jgi:peptidyl-prolyl cis-trans isomerase SurA
MQLSHLGRLTRRFTILACVLAPAAVYAEVTIMDEIICKVNGDIVTRSELERSRKDLEAFLREQGLTGVKLQEEIKRQEPDILSHRIDNLLLEQKAKEMDIKVDTEINRRMADVQLKSKITDSDKFQAFVAEQTGMPYEDYRGQLKSQLLRDRVISEEVSRKIVIKREEMEAYYNAHQDEFQRQERVILSEIFISTVGLDEAGIAAADKKAKDLVAKANKGDNFAQLATANSDRPSTAEQGGLLPPMTKTGTPGDHMPPELEALVWDKARGFVTDPIKFTNGFEILRVNEHQKAGLASLEEVLPEVQERLYEPRFTPARRGYLNKLRESAFLEIKPGYVDTGAIPNKDTTWVDPAQLKPETIKKEEILNQPHHKHILGIPLPGTSASNTGTSSSR